MSRWLILVGSSPWTGLLAGQGICCAAGRHTSSDRFGHDTIWASIEIGSQAVEGIHQLTVCRWYTASSLSPNEAGPSRHSATDDASRPSKRSRHEGSVQAPPSSTGTNPYADAAAVPVAYSDAHARDASPTYAPASPMAQGSSLRRQTLADDLDCNDSGESNHNAQPLSAHPPPPLRLGIHKVTGVSAQDAIAYAMTSQYWAGYWMGVAQAKEYDQYDHQHAPRDEPTESRVVVRRHDVGHHSDKQTEYQTESTLRR